MRDCKLSMRSGEGLKGVDEMVRGLKGVSEMVRD